MFTQESTEVREHPILRGFFEGIKNDRVQLNLRKNLGDADMTFDKTLEKAFRIEAVTRIEEDNEPQISAMQLKGKF